MYVCHQYSVYVCTYVWVNLRCHRIYGVCRLQTPIYVGYNIELSEGCMYIVYYSNLVYW